MIKEKQKYDEKTKKIKIKDKTKNMKNDKKFFHLHPSNEGRRHHSYAHNPCCSTKFVTFKYSNGALELKTTST